MSEKRIYLIDGKSFEQRELVLGQWRQLAGLLKDLELPAGGSRLRQLVEGLEAAGRLDRALAIVLVEVGQSPQDKDLDALERAIAFELTPAQIAEVLDDFFVCNPASSILSRLGTVLVKAVAITAAALQEIGSSRQSSPLPEETSPDVTLSSGDSPPVSAPLGSKRGKGKRSSEKA